MARISRAGDYERVGESGFPTLLEKNLSKYLAKPHRKVDCLSIYIGLKRNIREFKLHVLTANGRRQNGADSAYFFSN